MAKHTIIAARPVQILGHEDTVEPGTVLATIETDCDLSGLLSLMQFGSAIVDDGGEPEVEGEKPARRSSRRTASAPAAGNGSAATKSASSTRRRR